MAPFERGLLKAPYTFMKPSYLCRLRCLSQVRGFRVRDKDGDVLQPPAPHY